MELVREDMIAIDKTQMRYDNRNTRANKHVAYCAIIGAILLLVFIRNTVAPSLPVSQIVLGLVMLSSFVLTEKESIAMAISFTVMTSAFQYKYAIFIIIVIRMLKSKGRIKATIQFLPVILLLVWELLHAYIEDFSIIEYLRGFSELILLLYLFTVDKRKIDYKLLFRSFSVCAVSIGLIRLFIQISHYGFSLSSFWSNFYRFGELDNALTTYGLSSNENAWGFVCVLSAVAMLQLVCRKQHTKFDIVLFVTSIILGAFSISRTYLVLLAVVAVLYLLTTMKNLASALKGFLWLSLIAGAILIILNTAFPAVINNFIMRLNISDSDGSRGRLFLFFNDHIFSRPLYMFFGLGMQELYQKLQGLYSGVINVPHNGIQEVLVIWGLPGLLLFIAILTGMLKEARKFGRIGMLRLMPLIIVLVNSLVGQLFRSGTIMMALCFCYIALFYTDTTKTANTCFIAEER